MGTFLLGDPPSFTCHLHAGPPHSQDLACSCSSLGAGLFLFPAEGIWQPGTLISAHETEMRRKQVLLPAGNLLPGRQGLADAVWFSRTHLLSYEFIICFHTTSDTTPTILQLFGHQVSCNYCDSDRNCEEFALAPQGEGSVPRMVPTPDSSHVSKSAIILTNQLSGMGFLQPPPWVQSFARTAHRTYKDSLLTITSF